MPKRSTARTAMHPIQIVTRRTGLSAELIRAWEKRYGVVTPLRTPTARRLYSDADIQRLRLLAAATLTGRTIGQVATLPPRALAELAREGTEGTRDGRAKERADAPAAATEDYLNACLGAAERFDALALDAMLRSATVTLSLDSFLDALAVPLSERVAQRVRDGTLSAAQQHLTSAALRRVLDYVTAAATSPLASPGLVVTTPSGQPQEFGALVAAAAAAAAGWRVTYPGPGLPADDIAEIVARLDAPAVTLSLGTSSNDRGVPRELRRLRTLLPSDVTIFVAGAAAGGHRAVLSEIGASVLRDLPELRARLREVRGT